MHSAFQKRLFRTFSIFVAAIMVAFFGVLIYNLYNSIARESRRNLDLLTTRTSAEVESLLEDLDKLALYVSTNPTVTEVFREAAAGEGLSNQQLSARLMPALTSITIPTNSLRFRVSLFNDAGNHVALGPPTGDLTAFLADDAFADWYAALPIQSGGASYVSFREDEWSDSGTYYITLYREIYDPNVIGMPRGICEIQCPYRIVDTMLSFADDSLTCLLYDESGNMFYTSQQDVVQDGDDIYTGYTTGTGGSHGGLIYSGIALGNGWSLVLTQSKARVWEVLAPVAGLAILACLAVLAAALLVIFAITKKNTEPLRKLTGSIEKISMQNPALETDLSDYSDEFAGLQHAFGTMMDRLMASMDESVQSKAYEMRANMIALQNQMDPHFLFNVLSVIKAMSKEGSNEQIGKTCGYLASMLRYISAYDDSMVSFEAELAHCENYLKLMKLRYEDSLTYSIRVDAGLDTRLQIMPKLSLQPLVENCFKHAFKKTRPPWRVDIHAWCDGGNWFVTITDNGASIAEEAVARLHGQVEEFLRAPSDTVAALGIGGMGLLNTIVRLRLAYKHDIQYEFTPLPTGGTEILLGGSLHAENPVG